MPKTLYLVSFYFAPLGRADGVNRTYLARMLRDTGWNVEVICADNPRGLLRNYQQDPSLLSVVGTDIQRHPVPYRPAYGLAELASLAGIATDPFFTWRSQAIEKGVAAIQGDGVIMAIAPPVTNVIVAAEMARRTGLPLVIDFRDNVDNLPASAVSTASAFCASTPRSLDDMQRRYPPIAPRQGLAYFNGYPDEGVTSASGQAVVPGRYVYAGLLDWSQNPIVAARAAHDASSTDTPIEVAFYGPHNYYTRLVLPRALGRSAKFHGYLPYGQVMARIGTATAGVSTLFWHKDAYRLPSKVFQYIAAGRPVLAAAPEGALHDFVSKNEFGLTSPAQDVQALGRNMKRLASDAGLRDTLAASVLEKRASFSMRHQVRLLSDLLSSL